MKMLTNLAATWLALSFALSLVSAAEPPKPAVSATDLIGTWRLIEFTDVRDGKVVRAFGDKPLGIFIYTPSGHVSIHLQHNPLPQRFDDLNLTSAQQDALEVRSYSDILAATKSM